MRERSKPKVSIICLVYNHEKFLEDAIKGFLFQKTNFCYEVIIHDDASTDDSAFIIKKFHEQFPDIIRPVFQKENLHSKKVGLVTKLTYSLAKGDYVALCEGDDYWTDQNKLQKQVDFLENHPSYVLAFHNAIASSSSQVYNNGGLDLEKKDLIVNSCLHTSSVLFRWTQPIKEKVQSIDVINADTALYAILGRYGKGKYLSNIGNSVYRLNSSGIWSSKSERAKFISAIQTYRWILKNSPTEYTFLLREKILKKTVGLTLLEKRDGLKANLISRILSIIKLSVQTRKIKYLSYLIREVIVR